MPLNSINERQRVWQVGLALAGAIVLGVAGGINESASGQTPARHDDPGARALLGEIAAAYKALPAYSDQGQFALELTVGGQPKKQTIPMKLTFVRPNKLDFDTGQVRITSDGTTLTTSVVPLKRYTKGSAPKQVNIDTFREGPLGAILFGGPSGPPMMVLLNLLTAADPAASISELGGSLQPGAAAGAKPSKSSLLVDFDGDRPDILLTVDPSTKLLSGIDLKFDAAVLAKNVPAGQKVTIEKFGWNSGAVSTKVAKDRSFAFVAPQGATLVDTLLPKAEDKPAASEKLGKAAPDFTLTVLDGPGKTRTITKAELAGKVVLIDFWATWCGPCLMELPEIQKLIEAYAKTKKEVVVVALSQDSEPTELAAVRKLVEKTLTDKKLDLSAAPVGLIGLDPSNSVGTAFEVQGYPTLVILDGKGTLQSLHVGYDPNAGEPLHKSLAKEIETLLDGKSLVEHEKNAADGLKKAKAGD